MKTHPDTDRDPPTPTKLTPTPPTTRKRTYEERRKYSQIHQAQISIEQLRAEDVRKETRKRRFLAERDAASKAWEKDNGSITTTLVGSDGRITEIRGTIPLVSTCNKRHS